MKLIFNDFNLPGHRFLQYITVKLKVFAYCNELLRKHFRSLQNAPKRPPTGLLDPLWEPTSAPWSSKFPPKRHLKRPKELVNVPKGSPRRAQGTPRRPLRSPSGPQGIPEGSPRVPQGPQEVPKKSPRVPQGLQEVPKRSPRVPKGSPRGPQWVPNGFPRVTGRLRSRWNDGVAPKSAALRRRVRPVNMYVYIYIYIYIYISYIIIS